ncbi:YisL family protein [Salisediminibacterium halotolerans]|uniref:Uncharacterized protein n=1 Tax=Salisediminibacterium halotolerans TaxID=517425 RepID=A0A1H9U528_9BACI|nr:YisL family protein [Salisediminibacterium haloalkalitolerans]SES04341.1 Protein of unknown function [Salisediminibacterium haloalkalitolerans]
MNYSLFLHSHSLFWLIAVVLFGLIAVFISNGKPKPAKIMQMSLRLMYVLLLVTGGIMLLMNFWWANAVKAILAVWLIFVMEMTSTKMSKGLLTAKQKPIWWGQFVIALAAVLYFGYGL